MSDDVLAGCYVISLRPAGAHAALRRAAAAHGAHMLALSPWRLLQLDDAQTRDGLRVALDCERVVFTSPAAVRAAAKLQSLHARPGQSWFAVGAGTASALRLIGISDVIAPQRMDSEGVLALPGLQAVRNIVIGVVTAPGGRDLIASGLLQRGASIARANVYARVAIPLSSRAIHALCAIDAPMWLALSSGEALQQVLAGLPANAQRHLRQSRVVAASARLAQLAQVHGFADITRATSARPRDLLDAATHAALHPLA